MTVPEPPDNLAPAGAALWRAVVADVPEDQELTAVELAHLAAACRQADDVARLEAVIAADGAVVAGSAGQPRINAALTEVRQGRIALSKLLAGIAIPDTDGGTVTVTPASLRAQRAARSRWDREKAG